MIIVTGATGQLGRAIVQKLVERVPAARVGVSVRDPEKAADLAALGVRVRRGDFGDREGLTHAFEGAEQVLFVSSNARAFGGDPLAQHQTAIDAAREVGARRLVYTSHMAAKEGSLFHPMADHVVTEAKLSRSGLAWTALRNGFYGASGLAMLGDLAAGVVEAPADGPVAWAAHVDLAEAAAVILAREGLFDGPTPPLTGAEVLDFADLAGLAAESLGHTVVRKTITDDELRAKMAGRGVPGRVADIALGFYAASRNGEFGPTHPALGDLLGRPLTSMRDLMNEKFAR